MDITKYEKIFTQESEKYLQELDTLLMRVEKDLGNRDLWGEIHGKVHSIKGMARALSLERITQLSHSIEDWCKQFQQGETPVTPDAIQLIFDGTELLRVLVARKDGFDSPENQDRYDQLTSRFEKGPGGIPGEAPSADPSYPAAPSVPDRIDQVRIKYPVIEELLGISQEILLLENTLPPLPRQTAGLKNWVGHYRSMLKGLYFRLAQLRLVSVDDFAQLFSKAIRDLAKHHKKEVKVEVIGGEVQADIALMDRFREPFIHLLRNAIAHGVELPEERVEGGKAAEGKITLEAACEKDTLVLRMRDDGQGLNRSAIITYLKDRKSLTDEEIAEMPEDEFFNTILDKDFSSASAISDMAGRGIGMNVVSQAIEYLGGSMSIRSQPSKGTEFIIKLPLVLSVIYVVSFKIGPYSLCIPTLRVESIEKRESALREDNSSFYDLRALLGVKDNGRESFHVLRLTRTESAGNIDTSDLHTLPSREGGGDNGHVQMAVDSIIGNKPVMVMRLGEMIAKAGIFSGVGIGENGDLSLLLDLESLRGFSSM